MSSIQRTARTTGLLRLAIAILSAFSLVYVPSALIVAVLLYKIFKPVNKDITSMMVILILVGLAIAMLNELNRFAALLLFGGAGYLTAFTADQSQTLAALFLNLYDHGFAIAHIFWGLWLFPLGYLVFKSGYLPRILGILLMAGCFGYLIQFFQHFLFPSYEAIMLRTPRRCSVSA